ncbi:MAG TPA: hypothetical protein PKK17_05325, partial [Sphingorhabdus lacus]|nr:hypothetical protein [Sphingorhabdus lacus]
MGTSKHTLLFRASTIALALGGVTGAASPLWADATPECNASTVIGAVNATECGAGSLASKPNSTAVGNSVQATGTSSTAIGQGAGATGDNSTTTGASSRASGAGSTANGMGAAADGLESSAFGFQAAAQQANSAAFGAKAKAFSSGSLAFGAGAEAGGDAITFGNDLLALNAVALGFGAKARGAASLALGSNAETLITVTNAVALGSGSIAAENDVVSVGNATFQRRIVNVKAGTLDNDAVNFKQLSDLESRVDLAILNANPLLKISGLVTATNKPIASGENTIALGVLSQANGGGNVAIGGVATVISGDDGPIINPGVALGASATSRGGGTISIGGFSNAGDPLFAGGSNLIGA